MKYIGILTINDNGNYGNRLQNYALSRVLSKYGVCTTIQMYNNVESALFRFVKPIVQKIKLFVRYILSLISKEYFFEDRRYINGVKFTKKYISSNLFSVSSYGGLRAKNNNSLDILVIGSDQVWNVIGANQMWNYKYMSRNDLALRLGSFAVGKIPVISYAASFGASEILNEEIPFFQRYLPLFNAISVRESRGAELVKELTGIDAKIVLDPTLLLGTDEWNKITRGFVPKNEKYILTYFLGKPNDLQEQVIQKYANDNGCNIRRLLDSRDRETYLAGPEDFVELFSKATYVFTDSYHACCFAILYHKQFTVFNRVGMEGKANMNSRMENLFCMFNLDSVVMDQGIAPQINYEKVDKLLSERRADSIAYLNKAMECCQ